MSERDWGEEMREQEKKRQCIYMCVYICVCGVCVCREVINNLKSYPSIGFCKYFGLLLHEGRHLMIVLGVVALVKAREGDGLRVKDKIR